MEESIPQKGLHVGAGDECEERVEETKSCELTPTLTPHPTVLLGGGEGGRRPGNKAQHGKREVK